MSGIDNCYSTTVVFLGSYGSRCLLFSQSDDATPKRGQMISQHRANPDLPMDFAYRLVIQIRAPYVPTPIKGTSLYGYRAIPIITLFAFYLVPGTAVLNLKKVQSMVLFVLS